MKLNKKQLKNKLDVPTLVETFKELAKMSVLVGALYFLTEVRELDFDIYTGIVVAVSDVLIKLIQEIKKGI